MLYIIKSNEELSEFESGRWSEEYAKQIERGALVLPASHTLEAVYNTPTALLEAADE